MKTNSYIFCILLSLNSIVVNAQLEDVIVEKYYISGVQDTLDGFGEKLPEGSVTYRVFVDLEEDVLLKKVYADSAHPLIISSTENFFNHTFASKSYGYLINNKILSALPAPSNYALDSWLTIGFATDMHIGVLKSEDPDSSILTDGVNANNYQDAGIPLSEKDGLVLADSVFEKYGISENQLNGKLPFRDDSVGSYCIAKDFVIQTGKGFKALDFDNKILVAQITTHGELSFKLNFELFDSSNGEKYFYVSSDTLTGTFGTSDKKYTVIYSNLLIYPQKAGCTSPYFACYDPEAVKDDGSCSQCDSIVLGCLDPTACNYDENANFHVVELCCYGPERCDNRDISVVCPNYSADGLTKLSVYPNPAKNALTVNVIGVNEIPENLLSYEIYNAYGQPILQGTFAHSAIYQNFKNEIDISNLDNGAYMLRVNSNNKIYSEIFIKTR